MILVFKKKEYFIKIWFSKQFMYWTYKKNAFKAKFVKFVLNWSSHILTSNYSILLKFNFTKYAGYPKDFVLKTSISTLGGLSEKYMSIVKSSTDIPNSLFRHYKCNEVNLL